MKLIDLLVRELPKRGGWPDGAIEAGFLCSDTILYFVDENGDCPSEWRINMGESVEDNDVEISMNQYQSALAASQKVEWSGDGLPPVGCECEYIPGMLGPASSDDNKPIEPTIIKVVAHEQYPNGGNDVVVGIWMAKSGGMRSSVFSPRCLVNIRSEADKRRDAALDAIYGAIASAEREHNRSDEADKVYEAIAAGKILGVKLDD